MKIRIDIKKEIYPFHVEYEADLITTNINMKFIYNNLEDLMNTLKIHVLLDQEEIAEKSNITER